MIILGMWVVLAAASLSIPAPSAAVLLLLAFWAACGYFDGRLAAVVLPGPVYAIYLVAYLGGLWFLIPAQALAIPFAGGWVLTGAPGSGDLVWLTVGMVAGILSIYSRLGARRP